MAKKRAAKVPELEAKAAASEPRPFHPPIVPVHRQKIDRLLANYNEP